ncbi:MAG: hypothetical protein FRX48_06102 [Lasallia pustulata]|uniref:Uncharacterized protein n=1 Tax=Lasallia pustulata TaxID=136370 RepID=A0A5M8PML5_9LECA|nr:MAG: hypothetical protein FRX48_06102 [Lasallia pustulata]
MNPTTTLLAFLALATTVLSTPTSTNATCTTTLILPAPTFALGPTSTTYSTTLTKTSRVDCSGCALSTSTRYLGVGPVAHFTTTETDRATTRTVVVCEKSKR